MANAVFKSFEKSLLFFVVKAQVKNGFLSLPLSRIIKPAFYRKIGKLNYLKIYFIELLFRSYKLRVIVFPKLYKKFIVKIAPESQVLKIRVKDLKNYFND